VFGSPPATLVPPNEAEELTEDGAGNCGHEDNDDERCPVFGREDLHDRIVGVLHCQDEAQNGQCHSDDQHEAQTGASIPQRF